MAVKLRKIGQGYEVLLGERTIGLVEQTHPPLDRSGRWAHVDRDLKRRPEWIALDSERRLVGPSLTRRMAIEILRKHHRANHEDAVA